MENNKAISEIREETQDNNLNIVNFWKSKFKFSITTLLFLLFCGLMTFFKSIFPDTATNYVLVALCLAMVVFSIQSIRTYKYWSFYTDIYNVGEQCFDDLDKAIRSNKIP